jgi:acyl carrier protein
VCFLESTFGIEIADDEMLPENLDSIRAVSAYVQRKVAPRQAQLAAA